GVRIPCNDRVSQQEGYKPEVLAAHGFAEEGDYNDALDGRQIRWTSNDSSTSPLELYKPLPTPSTSLFSPCLFGTFGKIAGFVGKDIAIRQDNERMFIEQRHRLYGKCYTIYPGYQLKVKGRAVYYM
ncbi:Uncharacterized protein FKW44_022727, partial [Caligus rogercresseyi]